MHEYTRHSAHTHTHKQILCPAFRHFVIFHDNTIVSTSRDWLPRTVFRQRGLKIGFPLSCYITASRYVRLPAAVRYGGKLSDSDCAVYFIERNISCFGILSVPVLLLPINIIIIIIINSSEWLGAMSVCLCLCSSPSKRSLSLQCYYTHFMIFRYQMGVLYRKYIYIIAIGVSN